MENKLDSLPNVPSPGFESSSQVLTAGETSGHSQQDHAQVEASDVAVLFPGLWQKSTEDNNMSLYGFRRFKTTHLLNLRYLEEEIAKLTHVLYQAGLKLDLELSPTDRLGLRHSKRDQNALAAKNLITPEFISELRSLIKEYDGALAAFNGIMAMETFTLLDGPHHANHKTTLSLHERFFTRLIRVDLAGRRGQDPFQRGIQKCLRRFRYWIISRRTKRDEESAGTTSSPSRYVPKSSYQNSVFLAEMFTRFIVALATAVFLIVPLAILSYQSEKRVQLITISICVVIFSFLVSILMKTANVHTMAVAAAYAAVLSVFVSNGPGT